MKRWTLSGSAGALALSFLLALILAAGVWAQNAGRIIGQVLDFQGNPYPDVTVTITNPETGQTLTTKTDKNGKFIQIGLRGGAYNLNFKNEKDKLDYPMKFGVKTDEDNNLVVNFKELAAQAQIENPGAKEKAEAEEAKFGTMKTHFDAGVAAMNDAVQIKGQIPAAAPDQRSSLQDKMKADYQTAVTEFEQAEQAVSPKDVANHALVLGNLGVAYESAGRFDDALAAIQKAIALKPTAGYYVSLATDTAKAATAHPDPKNPDNKLKEAGAACDQAAALDPAQAPVCWRNLGIVYSNTGRMKEAAEALQKATQADPKGADSWYLLGGALLAQADTKQQGDKMLYTFPPGTAEAYQKYLELAPNGPHANDAKEMLAQIASLQGGTETTVLKKKKK